MNDLYKKIILLLSLSSDELDISDLVNEATKIFIARSDELSLEHFYALKCFLERKTLKCEMNVDAFKPLEKEIGSLDQLVAKLQIPKISIYSDYEQECFYSKEADLYDDLRAIFLNMGIIKKKSYPYFHNWALVVAKIVLDELEKQNLEESEELKQFHSILNSVLVAYNNELDEDNIDLIQAKMDKQREIISANMMKKLILLDHQAGK